MKPYQIESALDGFVSASGFEVPDPVFITGEFNLKTVDGDFYSDEAHLYCRPCAEKLLAAVLPHLPAGDRDEHKVWKADPRSGEDSCSHCSRCHRVLNYVLTEYGVESEIGHFEQHPPEAPLHPETAFHIARLIQSADGNAAVIKIAEVAFTAMSKTAASSGSH